MQFYSCLFITTESIHKRKQKDYVQNLDERVFELFPFLQNVLAFIGLIVYNVEPFKQGLTERTAKQ